MLLQNCYKNTWLQFVFPLYLWAIAFVIIVLLHYSQGTTKISIFLLSHAKFLWTIIAAVLPYPADHSTIPGHSIKICLTATSNTESSLAWLFVCCCFFLRSYSHFHPCRAVNKLTPLFDAYIGPFINNPKSHFWVGCLIKGILLVVYALAHYTASVSSLALIVTNLILLVAWELHKFEVTLTILLWMMNTWGSIVHHNV